MMGIEYQTYRADLRPNKLWVMGLVCKVHPQLSDTLTYISPHRKLGSDPWLDSRQTHCQHIPNMAAWEIYPEINVFTRRRDEECKEKGGNVRDRFGKARH